MPPKFYVQQKLAKANFKTKNITRDKDVHHKMLTIDTCKQIFKIQEAKVKERKGIIDEHVIIAHEDFNNQKTSTQNKNKDIEDLNIFFFPGLNSESHTFQENTLPVMSPALNNMINP